MLLTFQVRVVIMNNWCSREMFYQKYDTENGNIRVLHLIENK